MRGSEEKSTPDVLDSAQLVRIEAVHRGFLYQHLYAVGCLLLAQKASVEAVTVELDEDIELNSGQERIYVQVKTRLKPIILSDVSGALARFAELRNEHTDGRRQGSASFVIVANQAPGSHLQKMIEDNMRMSVLSGPSQPLSAIPHFPLPGTPWLMRPRGASRKQSN